MNVKQVNNLISVRSNSGETPALINKLEKHIDDYRKGRGNISKEVSAEIAALKFQSENVLAHTNPRAFLNFGAYSTMLPYDKKARYVAQLSHHTRTLKGII